MNPRILEQECQARENVESLLNELRVALTWAGIPESQINVATGFRYRIEHYVKAFDWLHQFANSPQIGEFLKVFALRPLYVWENYKLQDLTGLQEQILLEAAGKEVQKRWRVKRPRMFGPNKPQEENGEDDWSESETNCQDSA